MSKQNKLRFFLQAGFAMAFAGALFAQSTGNKILVVNGKTTGATIRQIDGRSYVDVETLAQATNGTVAVEPDRVVLTIPTAGAGGGASNAQQVPEGFSRSFTAAAIADLAE